MDLKTKLAPNFTFGELTSTSREAFLEVNRREALAYLEAGKALAAMMQVVRDHFNSKVIVHSGFRGPALNKAIGGSKTSQHMLFQACDFHVEGFTLRQVFDWIRKSSGLKYGQVILEGHTPGAPPSWVHLSLGEPWREASKCRQQMTFDGSKYTTVP